MTRIKQLDHAGSGGTELYTSRSLPLRRGSYSLRLLNNGARPVFGDRGAMISLTRFQLPAEAVIRGQLLRFIGWAGLLFGLVGSLWLTIRQRITS